MRSRPLTTVLAAALFVASALLSPTAAPQESSAARRDPVTDRALWSGLRYRLVGPFRGGRALAVSGVVGDPATYYAGSAGGGVWKTTDAGSTWAPVSDAQPFSAVGALAVAESDPATVWVGTGDACIRGDVIAGNGVYRSDDAGATWTHAGLEDTRHIGRIAISPRDPATVFIAALGHAYGPNAERGVFRTTNGGRDWQKVLFVNNRTGAIDIVFDPADPNVLFAALWEASRTPYSLTSGGAGSGLYRSGDGGATWRRLTGGGLPDGPLGRIGVAVSRADSRRVYAVIEAERGGLYRSDDSGRTWRLMSDSRELVQRAWYFGHITADPHNPDVLYVMNLSLMKSTDGGATFFKMTPQPHADNHALWIDPANPLRMINANDGGANITFNGGRTWSRSDNTQPTAQFYHVSTDDRFPYYLYGAQQDFETIAIASRSDGPGITEADWYEVGGCEMGHVVPHPLDPLIVYAGCTDGGLSRFDARTKRTRSIDPWPESGIGTGAASQKYRFQWTAPTMVSRHDPEALYHAGNVVFKSVDRGSSWTVISPDLTRNDKSKQGPSGGPITRDNVGTEYYDTIFALAESPKERGVLWAGSDDGLVHLTRDGGAHWKNVTPPTMPEWSLVSSIEPSTVEPGAAYLAIDRHKLDDTKPYIYKTDDYGARWTSIVDGLPPDAFVHVVRADPVETRLLYAGTELGVFVSFDGGTRWKPLQLNLPMSPVHDLAIHGKDLVVATHGRAFWILDDVAPLRELARDDVVAPHLFHPSPAVRLRTGLAKTSAASGENPPAGAVIYYSLPAVPSGELTLTIVDGNGNPVRTFSSGERPDLDPAPAFAPVDVPARLSTNPGVNRFVWNLRYPPARTVPNVSLFWHSPVNPPVGPMALPGRYEARLAVDGATLTAPFEIVADPRVSATPADLQDQFEFLLELRDRFSALTEDLTRIARTRDEVSSLVRRARAAPNGDVAAAASALERRIEAIEARLVERRTKTSGDHFHYPISLENKLSLLMGVVANADDRPTAQARDVYGDLWPRIERELSEFNRLLQDDLPRVDDLAARSGLGRIGR
jgi:photosystem II stability/assembly factor-like uncharacterized protein